MAFTPRFAVRLACAILALTLGTLPLKSSAADPFDHGWSFDIDGKLMALPDRDGYGDGFDMQEPALASPPRVESYRGMTFMSLDRNIVSLSD